MAETAGGRAHVKHLLGLYYLNVLNAEGIESVRGHLPTCSSCRKAAEQDIDAVAALAMLLKPVPDRPRGTERVTGTTRQHNGPAGRRPGGSRPGTAPRPERRRASNARTSALVKTGGLLSLVAILGLLGAGALLRGPADVTTPAVRDVAATAADTSTGASVSVIAAQSGGLAVIHATVDGLEPGARYELYAVTSDGTTSTVKTWAGTGSAQSVDGVLRVEVADLSFFTVKRSDGATVVSAFVHRGPAPTR